MITRTYRRGPFGVMDKPHMSKDQDSHVWVIWWVPHFPLGAILDYIPYLQKAFPGQGIRVQYGDPL